MRISKEMKKGTAVTLVLVLMLITLALLGGCAALNEPASYTTMERLEAKENCKAPNYWDARFYECKAPLDWSR